MTETDMTQRDTERGYWDRFLRRKFYTYPFLNRKLQFTFATILALIGIGNAAYLGVLFYFYARETFTLLVSFIPEYVHAEAIFDQHTRIFLLTVLFILIPEIALVTLWGLFFSHRIAGPLFNMGRKLEEISKGIPPEPVRLRKDDMLTDFADQMNQAISSLAGQRNEVTTALKELEEGNSKAAQDRLRKIIRPEPTPGSA
jgi:hypothetical protein